MASDSNSIPPPPDATRLAELEQRLARIEAHLGIATPTPVPESIASPPAETPAAPAMLRPVALPEAEDELEIEVGQNWFALAGVIALTAGAGFMLSLSYPSLPAAAPAIAGYFAAAPLFGLAHAWRHSFETVAAYLRGVAMVLSCFATLRLFHPAAHAAMDAHGFGARLWLLVIFAANFALALRRRSAGLTFIALALGELLWLGSGSTTLFLAGTIAVALAASILSVRLESPALRLGAMPLAYAAYFTWALGNPFFAEHSKFVGGPALAPLVLIVAMGALALAPLWRSGNAEEETSTKIGALLNCALGYGAFLVHTLAAYRDTFAGLHAVASVALLALAVAFWQRRESTVATFFYAMTGYAALSMAILKAAPMPDVFVWLSVQSLVVVTTAIWFRSPLIVVANFIIYVAIVIGYVLLAERENGISLGFGIVALLSARILNWQKDRLTLKTDLMRNAYLVSAFFVFPYALAHLVPPSVVPVAWIALAGGYYAMNFVVRNRKYRWLGHGTLLLTSIYVVVIGTRSLEPVYRTISFLVLGAVLLGVSLAFTKARRKTE